MDKKEDILFEINDLRISAYNDEKQEIPIGAVLVAENEELLCAAHNQTIALKDPTAHAEILALRQAADKVDNYRLLNTTLYVTVEPCPMCMAALHWAGVEQVHFGATIQDAANIGFDELQISAARIVAALGGPLYSNTEAWTMWPASAVP